MYHTGSGLFITDNTTISGNSASAGGGGLFNHGRAVLINVTLAENVAGLGGGINSGESTSAESSIQNVIIAESVGGNCAGIATISSSGNNVEDANTCGLIGPNDLPNTEPLLAPRGDNGGPTQTHALLIGSPAIDAGHNPACLPVDQRGVLRGDGNGDGIAICDIGAYEFDPGPSIPVCSCAPSSTPTPTLPLVTPTPSLPITLPLTGGDTSEASSTPIAVAALAVSTLAIAVGFARRVFTHW